jgi:hypothetical protein
MLIEVDAGDNHTPASARVTKNQSDTSRALHVEQRNGGERSEHPPSNA